MKTKKTRPYILAILCCVILAVLIIVFLKFNFSSKNFFTQESIVKLIEDKNVSLIKENVLEIKNETGSESELYIFSSPIAYLNNENKYVLKNNGIKLSQKGNNATDFINKENDIKMSVPENVDSEFIINMKKAGQSFNIYPDFGNCTSGKLSAFTNIYGQKKEAVAYSNVLANNNTFYVYFSNFGLETEMYLNSDSVKSYQYNISIPETTIKNNTKNYVTFIDKKGDIKAIVYKPQIHKTEFGIDMNASMEIRDNGNGNYTIKIAIIDRVLEEKSVNYPIKVVQSFYMYEEKEADTQITKKETEESYLNNVLSLNGNMEKDESTILVRYAALSSLGLTSDNLLSAEYIFNNLSADDGQAQIEFLPALTDWCSMNVRWSSKPKLDETNKTIISLEKRGEQKLDITKILRLEINPPVDSVNNYSIRNGFAIKKNGENSKVLSASDNGNFLNAIKLIIKRR